jgi:hypothetical protein
MKYTTLIEQSQHVYRFTPEKKLTDTMTAMAGVEVYDLTGKKIGGYAFTRSPKNAFDPQVTNMVKELIREHYAKKAWN